MNKIHHGNDQNNEREALKYTDIYRRSFTSIHALYVKRMDCVLVLNATVISLSEIALACRDKIYVAAIEDLEGF